MLEPITHLFTIIFYQPFFNLLVLFYEGLDRFFAIKDMGVALILFTIVLRLILLPLSLASGESEDEKREAGLKFEAIQKKYRDDPVKARTERDKLIKQHQRIVRAEVFDIFIQVIIALMLWRIFSKGLGGADLHLLYSFVPKPYEVFNLIFLGKVDLSVRSLELNLISSALIFIVETLSLTFSAYPATRNDRVMQVVVPAGVYIYLFNMPAGKKLFIITTLSITVLIILLRELKEVLHLWLRKRSPQKHLVSYGKLASSR